MSKVTAAMAALALVLAFGGACMAETHVIRDYGTLKMMLEERAEPGDILEVQPGVYYADSKRIDVLRSGTPDKPIIVRGVIKDGKRPVLDGSRVSTQRAMLYFPEGTHDVIVENLEICNAMGTRHLYSGSDYSAETGYGHGAEAMNLRGHNLTVRNCYIHHNGGGLFASHSADYILVENSEFAHNGVLVNVDHHPSHHFYFCAKHQMVKNCYLHDPRDGENFKSRGGNTIFAFNWVDEDYAYSIEQSSNGGLNTLWLGNVVAKRSTEGLWQGRVFAIGDGTGTVSGTVVAVNNTFVSVFPRDYFLFSFATGTADVVLINNAFAGPAEIFARHNGQGTVTGKANWLPAGITEVPESLQDGVVYGEDAGFVDLAGFDVSLKAGSPLINAGVSQEEYMAAIRIVTDNARGGTDVQPSPTWLAALAEIEHPYPMYEPIHKGYGFKKRSSDGRTDIGAIEFTGGR